MASKETSGNKAPGTIEENGPPEEPSHLRAGLVYFLTIACGLILLFFVLRLGQGLHAPKPIGGAAPNAGGGNTEQIVWKLLLAAAVIIVVARGVGKLFQWIDQPQVVGEIAAGLVLGPSVLGAVLPGAERFLFPRALLPHIDVLSQVGLVFYMFLVGLEFDPKLIRGRGKASATISHVSIIVPFLLGSVAALVLFRMLGSGSGRFTPFALFMGATMSITAFPVLARILAERGLYKTRLGAVALTCAAVDDITAWCMLAVVVAIARAHGPLQALRTIGLSVAFIVAMLLWVRPFLSRLARYHEERGQLPGGMLALLFVAILLSALITDRIGIHAIFGAFLLGAIMPQRSEFVGELVGKLEDFTVIFLLPLFFAFTGLRTNLGLLGAQGKLWTAMAVVLVVAVAGKWGGTSLAARAMKLEWRESMALGILMNTRGLTELIILNIGLDLRVIPPTLFAILVLMALVTTFMTTPLLSVFYPRRAVEQMVAAAQDGEQVEGKETEAPPYTILVPVAKAQASVPVVQTAVGLAQGSKRPGRIILLRPVRLPGSAYRAGPRVQENLVGRATQGLQAIVQLVQASGQEAIPLVVPATDVGKAIVRAVKDRRPDLVLMAYQRPLWGKPILHSVVGDVLRRAPADVAVLVNPSGRELDLTADSRIVVPHGGGFHEEVGLDLALRLAQTAGAQITVLGPGGDEKEAQELASRASRAIEDHGVWTVPVSVEASPAATLLEHARQHDLVVLGLGDEWARSKESLGRVREAVADRTPVPTIFVRRHGQRPHLRRPREWMEQDGEEEAVLSPNGDQGRHSAQQADPLSG